MLVYLSIGLCCGFLTACLLTASDGFLLIEILVSKSKRRESFIYSIVQWMHSYKFYPFLVKGPVLFQLGIWNKKTEKKKWQAFQ